jgi:hypothetical protein
MFFANSLMSGGIVYKIMYRDLLFGSAWEALTTSATTQVGEPDSKEFTPEWKKELS